MKKITFTIVLLFAAISLNYGQQTTDLSSLDKIFQKKGIVKDNIIRFNFPRFDLDVKAGNIKLEPAFALTSWIGIEKMGNVSMAMGDLALLEDEAVKVIPELISRGISVTAVHNHLLTERPKIIFVHYEASGNARLIAEKFKAVLSLTKTPFTNPPKKNENIKINWSNVEKIIGVSGSNTGDVISFGIPRKEKINENNMPLPPIMGTAISINFQKVGNKAITTGDFVLLAGEVKPVEEALTKGGVLVTALHTHMITEQPKLYFMHFWGYNKPEVLAKALKTALAETNSSVK